MISKHWFRHQLGVVRQQFITWTEVDYGYIAPYMASSDHNMMTSSNGNIFRVTGLCDENPPVTGGFPPPPPPKKASKAKLWCFLWSALEQTAEQKNRDAGDLRHHRAHFDVTVMNALRSVFSVNFSFTHVNDSTNMHSSYFHSKWSICSHINGDHCNDISRASRNDCIYCIYCQHRHH